MQLELPASMLVPSPWTNDMGSCSARISYCLLLQLMIVRCVELEWSSVGLLMTFNGARFVPIHASALLNAHDGYYASSRSAWAWMHFLLSAETAYEAKCLARAETGPCMALIILWAYDSNLGRCKTFIYGGCDGTDNKYPTEQECMATCRHPSTGDVPTRYLRDISFIWKSYSATNTLVQEGYHNIQWQVTKFM